ncbi:MAG: DNA translocase FtsK 4TM domain-containing protein, partial [Anaerolineaceae bacterium]|nr:DNA translocase FtsK 4TM domain-containing protein [Anaerolineaceae bacterium]
MARKNAPTRRPEPKKTPARTSRQRKQPSGSALANSPLRRWSWNRLSTDRKLDIFGVVMALIGMLTILSLASSTNGAVTGWWVVSIRKIAGLGSFILPIVLILVGVWLVLRNVERLPMLSVERVTGLTLLYLNILAWLHMLLGGGWALADAGKGGGYLGAMSERTLVTALGTPGALIVLIAWALIAIALTLDISVSELFNFFQKILANLARRVKERVAAEHALETARQKAAATNPDRIISELPPDFKPLGSDVAAAGSASP